MATKNINRSNDPGRESNGSGSTRMQEDGKWEYVIQSKYINPKTGNYKRVKRTGKTEIEARESVQMALNAWEKEIERGKDTKIITSFLLRHLCCFLLCVIRVALSRISIK